MVMFKNKPKKNNKEELMKDWVIGKMLEESPHLEEVLLDSKNKQKEPKGEMEKEKTLKNKIGFGK